MAELKSKFLGKLKGSLGDMTGRIRNGKGYLAERPASFNVPQDEASVKRRSRFKLSVKFSYAALKIPVIKTIWKKTANSVSEAFSNLMRENYKFIQDGNLSEYNIIIPRIGFTPDFTNIALTNSQLTADLNALDGVSDFDTEIETTLKIGAVIFLSEPNNPGFDDFDFIIIESEPVPLQLLTPESFVIPIAGFDSNKVDIYQTTKIFLAAFTLNDEGIPVHHSSTFVQ